MGEPPPGHCSTLVTPGPCDGSALSILTVAPQPGSRVHRGWPTLAEPALLEVCGLRVVSLRFEANNAVDALTGTGSAMESEREDLQRRSDNSVVAGYRAPST